MSKTYQNYPAAPTLLVSAVSYAALLPNISDMRLCKDNSVVLELYVGPGSEPLTDEVLLDLSEYFEVELGQVCVQPGEDQEHLFVEVWSTRFDFSDYFPEEPEQDWEDEVEDFVSEHMVLVEGEPFGVLISFDQFFNCYVAEVPGIPGGSIVVTSDSLESALSAAAEEIDAALDGEAERIADVSASLFDRGEDDQCDFPNSSCICDVNEEE